MTGSLPVDSERRRKVFVVHGRNEAARVAMFTFLRSIGLTPIEWSQAIAMTQEATPYIGEVLDVALEAAQAVIVLLSPDEIASLRAEYADGDDDPEARPSAQARPNVLFEAGLALGRAAQRTILVEFGKVRHFSDIAGRHVVRVSNSVASRQQIEFRQAFWPHLSSRISAPGPAAGGGAGCRWFRRRGRLVAGRPSGGRHGCSTAGGGRGRPAAGAAAGCTGRIAGVAYRHAPVPRLRAGRGARAAVLLAASSR
jgi:hypothetical protein